MSEYYTKQRGHLQILLESLISDDVDAYLYDSRDSALGGLSIISQPTPS